VNPGNVINTGDVVRIIPHFTKAAGIDYWGGWYGPEGSLEPAPPGVPVPGVFKYSPILRFNNNPGGRGDPRSRPPRSPAVYRGPASRCD